MRQGLRLFFVHENWGWIALPFYLAAVALFCLAVMFTVRAHIQIDVPLDQMHSAPNVEIYVARLDQARAAMQRYGFGNRNAYESLAATRDRAVAYENVDKTSLAYSEGMGSLQKNLTDDEFNGAELQFWTTRWVYLFFGMFVLSVELSLYLSQELPYRYRVQSNLRAVA